MVIFHSYVTRGYQQPTILRIPSTPRSARSWEEVAISSRFSHCWRNSNGVEGPFVYVCMLYARRNCPSYIYIYIYIMCVYIYICICVCICIHIYIYIYLFIFIVRFTSHVNGDFPGLKLWVNQRAHSESKFSSCFPSSSKIKSPFSDRFSAPSTGEGFPGKSSSDPDVAMVNKGIMFRL